MPARPFTGPSLSRRTFLRGTAAGALGIAAAGTLGACGSGESGAESDTLRVAFGWILNTEFGGYYVAEDKGYYAEEGLTVEFQGGGPNAPTPMQAVAAGSADIGIAAGAPDLYTAIGQGNDFVALGAQFQVSPAGLLSLSARPIRTPRELASARILGQEGMQTTLDAVLVGAGLDPVYDFTPVGFDPSPLVEGQGECYTCFVTNQPITLEQQYGLRQGDGYEVVTFADLGSAQYADVVFVDRTALAENRDRLVRFMRATMRGWDDYLADPHAAAALAVDKYGVDLGLEMAQQTRQAELQVPLIESPSGLFAMDVAAMEGPMWQALASGGYENLPAPASFVDLGVLAEARPPS
jgi:ABC-type nitrate/sulfonate/bicarbonate transport system substrate-binding protein